MPHVDVGGVVVGPTVEDTIVLPAENRPAVLVVRFIDRRGGQAKCKVQRHAVMKQDA